MDVLAVLFDMKTERSNIEFPMWRKKVDDSLLNDCVTPLPNWLSNIWDLTNFNSISKNDQSSEVIISFNKRNYRGHITRFKDSGTKRRLHFDRELGDWLKSNFLMSYVISIEKQLSGKNTKRDLPEYWEFLDIEFNQIDKTFIFTAYFKHPVEFPNLFKKLVESHIIGQIENLHLDKKLSITNSKWKQKAELELEINDTNVIYNLIDIDNKVYYIGEAQSLRNRLNGYRPEIPNWTHYRYDVLPSFYGEKERKQIERLLIRTFASVLENEVLSSIKLISEFRLANKKIDS
jgi:hypothetical protein